jgi:signal transduction histidine kinase/CheY-like chemotaxis protein/PAS domain-containing protein
MKSNSMRAVFFSPSEIADRQDPLFWEQYIFTAFSLLLAGSGLYLSVTGALQFYHERNLLMVGFDIAAYLLAMGFAFIRRIPFRVRKRAVTHIILLIGMAVLIATGPRGVGHIYILSSFICAGLLENRKGVYVHITLAAALFGFITILLFTGLLSNQPVQLLFPTWLLIVTTILIIGTAMEIVIHLLMQGTQQQSIALRKQQQDLKRLFDSSHDPILTIDERLHITDLNRAAAALFGGEAGDLMNRDLFEAGSIIDPHSRTSLIGQLQDFFTGDEGAFSRQALLIGSDTAVHHILFSIAPVFGGPGVSDSEGKQEKACTRAIIVLKDITKEKEIQDQLRQYEWLTEKGDFTAYYENPAIAPTYGSSREGISYNGNLQEQRATGTGPSAHGIILESVGKETLLTLAKDSLTMLDTSFTVIEANGDTAIRLVVSEWCRLLDSWDTGSGEAGQGEGQGGKAAENPCRTCRMEQIAYSVVKSGTPAEAICSGGLHLYSLPVIVRGNIVGAVSISFGAPPAEDKTLRNMAAIYGIPPDTLQKAALKYKPRPQFIIDAAKYRLQSTVRFIEEIVERNLTEEELQKARSLKQIGYLAGGIAHDFNNILTGIFGYISLAKSSLSQLNPAYQELVRAESSMNRAKALTGKLLTFSKGGEPVKTLIDPAAVIEEIVQFDLSGSNVKAFFHHDPDLHHIYADRTQIQQLFSNLTINADQAMDQGGELHVTLANCRDPLQAESDNPFIRITFRDTGIGIAQNNINHIFDPYFSLKPSGSGLGLATVYSIVTRHGGTVDVNSAPGNGTTFTITLPAAREVIAKKAAESVTLPSSAALSDFRVLVMDDEPAIRKLLTSMLAPLVSRIETAPDGETAIALFREAMEQGTPFTVVILDLTIPGGMGGIDAFSALREIDPKVCGLVSTGYADNSAVSQFRNYGFSGAVAKPFTRKELTAMLLQAVRNR